MRDGVCPKCGSTEVYSNAQLPQFVRYGSYYANSIPITVWRNVALDVYVCAACGFVERYVSDPAKLSLITRKWPRAGRPFERLGARAVGSGRTCPECHRPVADDWQVCPNCGQPLR
jgi:RNA polymerase subunit RPABC4/transcription elongation factor Spt4